MIDPQSWDGPLRSQFQSDDEMRELIEAFVGEMPERIAELQAAWEHANAQELRRLAHSMKGAAPGYGFPIVGDAAAELESVLRKAEHDLASARAEFETLVTLCSRTSA